jgi:putative ABC transport system permease protein
VCVIGATVRKQLFGRANPVGERVRLGKIPCEVVGVLASKGQSNWGRDQDDLVLVPLRTFQRRVAGNNDIETIYVSARDGVDTERVQREIEALMRERRRVGPGAEDDFHVRDMRQLIEAMTSTTTALTSLLGAVAAVSLLVGGIGIMNIMLVSVTERTREIGIRLAIGALERQVLVQFLVEAVVLSLVGGLIGIVLGLGLGLAASRSMGVPFVLDLEIALLAFVFSAVVGVVFGYFPAQRAARLDPIVALRHE